MPALVVAGLVALAPIAPAAADRDPDARDHGDFWREVVHPHADEVTAITRQLAQVLDQLPGDWRFEHRLAVVHEAERLVRYGRSLDPGAPELIYFQGMFADEAGHAVEAQRRLVEFLARGGHGPHRLDALTRLGTIALRQGRADDAVGFLRRAAAEKGPRRAMVTAQVYLAHALDAAGRTGAAIELLAPLVDRATGTWEQEDAALWLTLAVLYDRDEQITAAFDMVTRAQAGLAGQYAERLDDGLRLAPPVPAAELHYYRGFVYETAGFLPEARAEWRSYASVAGTARYHPRARAHVDGIDAILAARRPTTRRSR